MQSGNKLHFFVASAIACAATATISACGTDEGSHFIDDGGSNVGADGGASNNGDGGSLGDSSFTSDAPAGDAGAKVGEVWAHSADTLYKLEPFSKVTTVIGPFSGCSGQVIDIALDKNGSMFATTFASLERVDKTNAKCTTIAQGSFPNSLTFVPAGTLDANVEALVGFEGDSYVRFDTSNGNKTTIGALNPNSLGHTFISSGDVVSIIGDKTYLTVKVSNPSMSSDAIIEVDPKTGKAVKLIGETGQQDIFGLGYWAGTAYGFTNGGQIFAIDLTNGTSTNIPIPNPPAGLSFWGAGVTTAAPIEPPR